MLSEIVDIGVLLMKGVVLFDIEVVERWIKVMRDIR